MMVGMRIITQRKNNLVKNMMGRKIDRVKTLSTVEMRIENT